MATIQRTIKYRCSDDCVMSGCPGHDGELIYQSTADAYAFYLSGRDRELHFERGELEALLDLLKSLDRVDSLSGRIN